MGFGLPAAMGVQAAHPDALVVDIDGDGSFQMNIQEMATCYCEKLPVKVLLLDNQHLGMVVQWEDRFHGRQPGPHVPRPDRPRRSDRPGRRSITSTERYPDFVTIAKGYGWGAATVSKKADLTPALEEMINYRRPVPAERASPLRRARAADDPRRQDGGRYDFGVATLSSFALRTNALSRSERRH